VSPASRLKSSPAAVLRRLIPTVVGIAVVTALTSALGIEVFGPWWQTAAMLAFISVLAWCVPLLFSSPDRAEERGRRSETPSRKHRDVPLDSDR